jgi:hypothetical protein
VNASASITITPVHVAGLLAEGELMPVYVHVIDHPDGRVLVDTDLTELHPLVADMDPRRRPWSEQDVDPGGIDMVVKRAYSLLGACEDSPSLPGRRREIRPMRGSLSGCERADSSAHTWRMPT